MEDTDALTVEGFGEEWSVFDQEGLDQSVLEGIFESYFSEFPWGCLPADAVGVDIGAGSGRWAKLVEQRGPTVICVEPSAAAIRVAARLQGVGECPMVRGAAGQLPFRPSSVDFGYSLGVLHHTPDAAAAMRDCVTVLRPGAPFLVYLYYRFDNRAGWFRALWRATDLMRRLISRMGFRRRYWITQAIALFVYWPLARIARVLERGGVAVEPFPLSLYRDKPFYVMRNDALDRFGTRLEHRFTRHEIEAMMRESGLRDVVFREKAPYWCAVGYKA